MADIKRCDLCGTELVYRDVSIDTYTKWKVWECPVCHPKEVKHGR